MKTVDKEFQGIIYVLFYTLFAISYVFVLPQVCGCPTDHRLVGLYRVSIDSNGLILYDYEYLFWGRKKNPRLG